MSNDVEESQKLKLKRRSKTTEQQYEIYLREMENNVILRTGTVNPTLPENYMVNTWENLAIELNAVDTGPSMTAQQWQKEDCGRRCIKNIIDAYVDDVTTVLSIHGDVTRENWLSLIRLSTILTKLEDWVFGTSQTSRKENLLFLSPECPQVVMYQGLSHYLWKVDIIDVIFLVYDSKSRHRYTEVLVDDEWKMSHINLQLLENSSIMTATMIIPFMVEVLQRKVYFIQNESLKGNELWTFGTRPGSFLMQDVNKVISSLRESGLLDYQRLIYKRAQKDYIKYYEEPHSIENVVLGMKHVFPIFLFWGAGMVIATVAFVLEHFTYMNKIEPLTQQCVLGIAQVNITISRQKREEMREGEEAEKREREEKFPKNEARRATCLKNINMSEYWSPTRSSRLCSKHFTKDCFDRTSSAIVRLYSTAIPTIQINRLKHARSSKKEVVTHIPTQETPVLLTSASTSTSTESYFLPIASASDTPTESTITSRSTSAASSSYPSGGLISPTCASSLSGFPLSIETCNEETVRNLKRKFRDSPYMKKIKE
ncbi:hypothetical protein FQA39_LY12492 [Lamprigera yunnana]|nr:hypothetical protein FQA39_LY12492 [Lamprigera yunnana]